MGSIIEKIDDILEEYGSWDNYLKATETKSSESIGNSQRSKNTKKMRIVDFKEAYDKLEAEMIVAVLIASTFEYGSYKNYHAAVYRVVSITQTEINFQNVNHKNEWLMLDVKSMERGQFRIEY